MKIFSSIKKVVLTMTCVVIAIIALLFYVRFLIAFGVISLLVATSFAIVGRGNRLLWLFLSPFAFVLLIIAPYFAFEHFAKQENGGGILLAILGFALMPILPGLFLSLAHAIRLKRSTPA